jgi:hypothetical protein
LKLKIDPEFFKQLKEFKKRLFNGTPKRFAYQKWGKGTKHFQYDWKERPLQDQDLVDHFYKKWIDKGAYYEGALGFPANQKGIIKRICFDLDDGSLKQFFYDQIAPKLDGLDIDYILEHGGDDYERGHVSILTHADKEVSQAFLRQFMGELGEPILKGADERFFGKDVWFDEIYGGNKFDENLRFIYAYHIKRMKRYHLTKRNGEDVGDHEDELYPDVVPVIKAFNEMKILDEEFMKGYIKDDFFPASVVVPKINYRPEEFVYESLDLPLPTDILPGALKKCYQSCPALAGLLDKVYNQDGIQKAGLTYHNIGLAVAGTFRFYTLAFDDPKGKEIWEEIKEKTRFRSDRSHHWWYGPDKSPYTYMWTCDKYDKYFGMCEGCPWRGMINSPRELIAGKKLKKEINNTDKRLATIDEVRTKTFPAFKEHVKVKHREGTTAAFALRSRMGTGKTWTTYDLIAELINENDETQIMLSVHDGKAALAAKMELEKKGIDVFVLMSHENIFGHQAKPPKEVSLAPFDCRFYDEIQNQSRAGVLSTSYKSEFCKNCPLFDDCYYPKQYSEVLEPEHRVVIIQHAHFSCEEIIVRLAKKQFDFLIIDENFLKYTSQYLEVKEGEIDLLNRLAFPWCERLVNWMTGIEDAYGQLDPNETQLQASYTAFKEAQMVYRVPDLLRLYNRHRTACELTGIEVVYELPHIPIKIFLDGTMPLNLIKKLTGIEDLIVYGDDEIIDIEAVHPANLRYQIMDISNSQYKLSNYNFFNLAMTRICEAIRDEFQGKKFLITCYSSMKDQVREFISDNFPQLLDSPYHIDIGLMNKGTNKWADYDGQVIIAGRYRLGKGFLEEVYRLKSVYNWYRIRDNLPPIQNLFPLGVTEKTSISKKWEKTPYKCLMKIGDELKEVVFSDIFSSRPIKSDSVYDDEFWISEIAEVDIGDMEQCERVRLTPEKPRTIIHMHNRFMPDLMINKPVTFQQFLALPRLTEEE